jgi:mannosyltransferase OCH1-like enzyme
MFKINNTSIQNYYMKNIIENQKRTDIQLNQKSNNNKNLKIPKNIFQVYLDTKIPLPIKEHMNKFKNKNPGWKYTLFHEEDINEYIKKNYPEYLEFYLKINPEYKAARVDFFRYLLMYKEGGVYLDCKSIIFYPLDKVINSNDEFLIFSSKNHSWHKKLNGIPEYSQWIISCIPNHPFLKAVIDNVIYNIKNYKVIDEDSVGWIGTLDTTGPFVYTKTINKLLDKYNHRFIESRLMCQRVAIKNYYNLIYNDKNINYTMLKSPIIF